VDLTGCTGSQSPYVMLSRVTDFESLFILRPFKEAKIKCRPSEDLRRENLRLKEIYLKTLCGNTSGSVRQTACQELNELINRKRNAPSPPPQQPRKRRRTRMEQLSGKQALQAILELCEDEDSSDSDV
jgi:hypothetical protein